MSIVEALDSMGIKLTDEQEEQLLKLLQEQEQQRHEDMRLAECESQEALRDEWYAHGYDFDEEHKHDPYTGVSEYDLDPGVVFNDGGEPKGYM